MKKIVSYALTGILIAACEAPLSDGEKAAIDLNCRTTSEFLASAKSSLLSSILNEQEAGNKVASDNNAKIQNFVFHTMKATMGCMSLVYRNKAVDNCNGCLESFRNKLEVLNLKALEAKHLPERQISPSDLKFLEVSNKPN